MPEVSYPESELFSQVFDPFGGAYIMKIQGEEFAADFLKLFDMVDKNKGWPQGTQYNRYREVLADNFVEQCIGNAAMRAADNILDDVDTLQLLSSQRNYLNQRLSPDEQLPNNSTHDDIRRQVAKKLKRNAELGALEGLVFADGVAERLLTNSIDPKIRISLFIAASGNLAQAFGTMSDDRSTHRLYNLTKDTSPKHIYRHGQILGNRGVVSPLHEPKTDLRYHKFKASDVMSGRLSIHWQKFELQYANDWSILEPLGVRLPEASQPGDNEDRQKAHGCPLARLNLLRKQGGKRLMRIQSWVIAHAYMAITSQDRLALWPDYDYKMGIPPFPFRSGHSSPHKFTCS